MDMKMKHMIGAMLALIITTVTSVANAKTHPDYHLGCNLSTSTMHECIQKVELEETCTAHANDIIEYRNISAENDKISNATTSLFVILMAKFSDTWNWVATSLCNAKKNYDGC